MLGIKPYFGHPTKVVRLCGQIVPASRPVGLLSVSERTYALSVTLTRRTVPETSSPYPPSSTTWNQHEVMRAIDAVCACTPYWTYSVPIGVEPIRAVHAQPVGLAPPRGCARLPRHRLPARLSQEDWSSSLPLGCEYPAHATL